MRPGTIIRYLLLICMCIIFTPVSALAAGDEIPVPFDGEYGGLIHSNIYGDVVVVEKADGQVDYTFLNSDWNATRQLLAALRAGKQIDLAKLLTQSSTGINDIKTHDNWTVENNIIDYGADASANRGTYSGGSVYGPGLSDTELSQVQSAVSAFLIGNSTENLSDAQKVRIAQDYLRATVLPAPKGSYHRADDAWGALVYGEANAKGFARAMKALCDAMGVGSMVVSANSKSSVKDYMWNLVKVDGKWYIEDAFCNITQNTNNTFLVSDAVYEYYGMRWDKKSEIPVCRYIYGR